MQSKQWSIDYKIETKSALYSNTTIYLIPVDSIEFAIRLDSSSYPAHRMVTNKFFPKLPWSALALNWAKAINLMISTSCSGKPERDCFPYQQRKGVLPNQGLHPQANGTHLVDHPRHPTPLTVHPRGCTWQHDDRC